ncbi:CrcB family protein [Bacillus sp. D386]|uniref:fluoride efflux transporter FluC n=1 Tax=Bacillus sp. D386 TaxID=2587155 RepID=UPI00111FF892|nr:CrcB family protein [Bacillus sp. D386]
MQKLLLTGCGGAMGALARYGISLLIPSSGSPIPFNTLFINGFGSFVLAYLTYSLFKNEGNERLKLFFGTGLCGGFTTMSSFSLEITNLAATYPLYSLIYFFLSMIAGLLMAWLGFIMSSWIKREAR